LLGFVLAARIAIGSDGAPRPMKMRTIASPWRYDGTANHALKSARLQWTTILCTASRAAPFLILAGQEVSIAHL
jgi:hypothetical protein